MRETAERSARVFSSRQRSRSHARVARRASLHETLETRALLSVNAGDAEALAQLAAVHPQSHSCGCAGCTVPPPPADYRAASMYQAAAAPFPLGDTFKLHSLPTATKKIYLDFDGHLTTKTLWQTYFGHGDINTPAFSLDSDYAAFSDADKTAIQEIWARVAEDFAPFDVDVTTEDPGIDALVKSGVGDTAWGLRVVVGGNGSWYGGAAGVAVMEGFGASDGSPAFAFADQWWKTNPNIVTGCISHEVGHALGLSHDGPGYYGGHGTGPTSWGPIMGNGDKGLTHWNNGDYRNANNKEDDLAIITTNNGFGYRADDHGNTSATATNVAGTTAKGVIERNTDLDVFKLTSSGTIQATIKPAEFGANLDILAEILDSTGTVIHTSNPIGAIDASFNVTVAAGTYYLRVQGTGEGDPLGTGYSKYGSLGQYTVTLGGAEPPPPPPGTVTLSVGDITIAEGNAGTSQATLTFTLSAAAASAVTVQYATVDGTATTAGDDYTAATGTITFAAGETQKTVALAIQGDTKSEPNETFTVALSNPVGATLTRQAATVTITNDDDAPPPPPGVPALSIADVSVAEGNAGNTTATLTLTLSAAASTAVTVGYSTIDGTATAADNDYIAATVGTVTFAPGETQKTIALTVRGDTKVEPDERFVVRLSNPQGATLARSEATVLITNDDSSTPPGSRSLSVNDVTVSEGNTGTTIAEFTVSLSSAAPTPVTVWFKTADGTATTADRDYLATTGSLTFLPGETSKPVRVAVSGDVKAEAAESFALVLSSPRNATIARGRGTATITNDDMAKITASIGDASIREGHSGERVISFVVTLSAAPREPITMTVRTIDGTATSGTDYTPLSRTITFGRGMVKQTVSVWVRGDKVFEPNESFSVELTNLVGATVGRGTAQGTILNDDAAPAANLVQMAAWAQISQAERPSAAKAPLSRAR